MGLKFKTKKRIPSFKRDDIAGTGSGFAGLVFEIDTEGNDLQCDTEADPTIHEFLDKMVTKLQLQSVDDMENKSSSVDFFDSVKSPDCIDETSDETPSFAVLPGEEVVDCVPDKHDDSERTYP